MENRLKKTSDSVRNCNVYTVYKLNLRLIGETISSRMLHNRKTKYYHSDSRPGTCRRSNCKITQEIGVVIKYPESNNSFF